MEMLKYIEEKVSRETHIYSYPEREVLFKDFILTDSGKLIIEQLMKKHSEVLDKYKSKKTADDEGYTLYQLNWAKAISEYSESETWTTLTRQYSKENAFQVLHAIGKHLGDYIHRDIIDLNEIACVDEPVPSTSSTTTARKKIDFSKENKKEQPDAGLHILAGACLGLMFKALKKQRRKGSAIAKRSLQILAKIIVIDKKNVKIGIAQRARDHGGLYIIKNVFLPFVRDLDCVIRSNLSENTMKKERKQIVKITNKDVKACEPRLLEAFKKICSKELKNSDLMEHVDHVFNIFVRKYTNARINGFIRGYAETQLAKKGHRSKGGASLRDSLFVATSRKKVVQSRKK